MISSANDLLQVEPLEKEEPMQDSPIFSPIPDSVASVTSSDTYYTAQEEVEEEITEIPVKPKLIERPKVVPLEQEKLPESPVREIVAPVEAMEVEPEEESKEVRAGYSFYIGTIHLMKCNTFWKD